MGAKLCEAFCRVGVCDARFDRIYACFHFLLRAYYCLGIAGDASKEKCSNEEDACNALPDGAGARFTRRLRREKGRQRRERQTEERNERKEERSAPRRRYERKRRERQEHHRRRHGGRQDEGRGEKSCGRRAERRRTQPLLWHPEHRRTVAQRRAQPDGDRPELKRSALPPDGFLFDGENTHFNTLR